MQLVNMSSGVNLTYKEAYALKVESLNKHGIGFVEFCDRFGMSHKEWHHLYHESLDANLTAPTPLTARHLEGFPVNVVILSHASRGWIDRKLRDFAIKKMFPDEKIFAFEDVGYNPKSNGGEAYRILCGKMSVAPEETVMVDDSLSNLISAKKAGMNTVLITQGKNGKTGEHECVDAVFSTLPELVASVKQTKPAFQRQRGLRLTDCRP